VPHLQQVGESLGVELVVTQVQRRVDGLEGLEVDGHLARLAVLRHHLTAVHNQTVGRTSVVQFEALLGAGNGRQHGQAVHA
jgi:hypothetical protein